MGLEYRILANNNDITNKIKDRLIRLTLTDTAGINHDTLDLELDNRDQVIKPPSTGAEISVYLGDIFKGVYTVDEVEEPLETDTLTIRAQAAKMKKSFKVQRDKSYDNITFGVLLEQIASRHDYAFQISPELKSIVFSHIDQVRESDSNLLSRLARDNDAVFKVANNTLLIVRRERGKTASGKTLPVIIIDDPENSQGRVTLIDREDFASVKVHYFDEAAQQEIAVVAGSGEPQYVIRRNEKTESAAKQRAESKLKELQRGKSQLQLTRPLNPNLIAERLIELKNHKTTVNGKWLVDSVTHTIESNAWASSGLQCVVV